MARSAAVTVVAVLALMGSLLTLFVAAAYGVAMYLVLPSMMKEIGPQPPYFRSMMIFMVAALAGHGIWGIATAIGLFRLKRWARTSVLLFSGVLVFFAASSLFVLFLALRIARPTDMPDSVIHGVMIGFSGFYGLLLLIGVWWLILFTRASVKAQFQGAAGAPVGAPLPISITVIAWYMLSTCLAFPLALLVDFPGTFFGVVVTGWAAKVSYAAFGTLGAIAGYGLLKRKAWAYWLTVSFFAYAVLNAAIFYVLPGSAEKMREFSRQILPPEMNVDVPTPPVGQSVAITLLFVLLPLYFLLTRRKRYLEACQASPVASTQPQG